MSNNFGRLKNIAKIGDIIVVDGYGAREFQVESYTHEIDYQPEYVAETIMYDITDLITHEFLIAYQEDISVVCRAENADEYLRGKSGHTAAKQAKELAEEIVATIDIDAIVEETFAKAMPSIERRIDEKLAEISDYKTLIEMFGDEDGAYQSKIDEIKTRLAELMKGGK